jgi:protease-4
VIIRGNNLSELLDKVGIKFETVKSGVFKDILSPDKPLSEDGRRLLQGLIDESYKQFTEAVAEGRNLPVEKVREFADGRIFTGSQAKDLGLVDEVGDEFVARELAAKMVNIDPKIQPLTFGKKKKKILGLIPGSRMIEKIINNIFFEFDSSNKVLWLYKP